MSEEQKREDNMDRKSGRQSSVTPKGAAIESKKDNSNSSSQKYARKSKSRDVSNREQTAYSRRPQPQKTRFLDKRPRPRGFHNGNNHDEMTLADRTEPEHGSVHSWGSKKTNLSHLLNFHFEPRELYGRGRGSRGLYRKGRGRGFQGHANKYNKEHFLQANCQFIVKERGDYTIHAVDPDTLVDWDLIEQVRVYGHSVPSCPICLYPPTAAKITKCGHIYCTSCILHYLSLSEKPWRRCPICYDAVQQKDLKSVLSLETHWYTVGQEITMKLMKRQRGTTLALPVEQWSDNSGHLYNIVGDVDTRYIKLLAISPAQVQEILNTEKEALQHQLKEEGIDSLEGSYIQAALDILKVRESSLVDEKIVSEEADVSVSELKLAEDEDETQPSDSVKSAEVKSVLYADAFFENVAEDVSVQEDCANQVEALAEDDTAVMNTEQSDNCVRAEMGDVATGINETNTILPEATEVLEEDIHDDEMSIPLMSDQKKVDYYYFYQAADGQHIYPHSINARCLIKEYGSLEKSPLTITAKIVELEDFTMNEELRSRLRYLSHLPVTCEFQIAELALKPPLVSKETLRLFSGEIDRKKKQRQRKTREETKLSQRIKAQENKELGIDPRALIVPSEAPSHIVPSATVCSNPDTESVVSGSPGTANSELLATSPPSAASSDEGGHTGALSFAQMLRAGKAKPQEMLTKGSNEPSEPRTVTKGSESETDEEDHVPVPVYQASFGDAIQQALDKYMNPGTDNDVAISEQASGGKKKKKKQKTLLFATTMNRAK